MILATATGNQRFPGSPVADWAVLLSVFFGSFGWLIYYAPALDFLVSSVDQGSQMTLGIALLAGRVQGIDIVWVYGPLVGWASALGLKFAPGYTGEVVICAFGYALSLTIMAGILLRRVPLLAVLAAVLLTALLLSRFYKWYYWFFPLLQLALCLGWRQCLGQTRAEAGILFIWGLSGGIAFLFRPDLGALSLGLFAVIWAVSLAESSRGSSRVAASRLGSFVAGYALVQATWIALYGFEAWLGFIVGFAASLTSAVVDAGQKPTAFRVAFAIQSTALLVIQVGLPCLAAATIWVIIRGLWRGRRIDAYRSALLVTALVSLGVYPQAMHRADAQHLLQVIPPFILLLSLLAFVPGVRLSLRLLVALMLPPLLILVGAGRVDLDFRQRDFSQYWATVAGLPYSFRGHPSADMAAAIMERTDPADGIYTPMRLTPSPVLVMAGRYMTGLYLVHFPTYLEAGPWAARHREAVLRSDPKYLLVLRQEWTGNFNPLIPPFDVELLRRWHHDYSIVVYENRLFQLLARPAAMPAADG
ncbi:hypothetical protein [Ferrovibrio sp.]|uniref:hypothetical protein n=1 Tax=Ferrovibrio sp. TaxID=1917215 RepID=UPI003D10F98B